jgi:hypothetical protein
MFLWLYGAKIPNREWMMGDEVVEGWEGEKAFQIWAHAALKKLCGGDEFDCVLARHGSWMALWVGECQAQMQKRLEDGPAVAGRSQ